MDVGSFTLLRFSHLNNHSKSLMGDFSLHSFPFRTEQSVSRGAGAREGCVIKEDSSNAAGAIFLNHESSGTGIIHYKLKHTSSAFPLTHSRLQGNLQTN